MRDEWSYVYRERGVLYVTISGTAKMLRWYAINWALISVVSTPVIIMYYENKHTTNVNFIYQEYSLQCAEYLLVILALSM